MRILVFQLIYQGKNLDSSRLIENRRYEGKGGDREGVCNFVYVRFEDDQIQLTNKNAMRMTFIE